MGQPQIIEGTSEEIAALLKTGAFAGRSLKLIVAPEEEDLGEGLPAPPNAIRDRPQLDMLLLEGLASPQEAVPDQEWTDLRQEVRDRLMQRNQ